MKATLLFSAVSLLLTSGTVCAAQSDLETLRKDIAKCAAPEGAAERLACFDGLAKREGLAKPSTEVSQASGSHWHHIKQVNPVDDSLVVVIVATANLPITGWPSTKYTPKLYIRCLQNKTEVYIDAGMPPNVGFGTDTATVTLRVDKNPAKQHEAGKSTDGHSLFIPKPIGLLKSMFGAQELFFQFTPFNSSPAFTTFDVSGLEEEITELRKTCNW